MNELILHRGIAVRDEMAICSARSLAGAAVEGVGPAGGSLDPIDKKAIAAWDLCYTLCGCHTVSCLALSRVTLMPSVRTIERD
ncbi:MAG: hypothetical protein FD153_347 [Rhodospirillaceae bacterium]|nr:MAG: hypothetical protein FD153_347 [Rhodospirillaceae bacterium]